eukprot:jgi/Phyca11/106318/e_gw1.12.264.1
MAPNLRVKALVRLPRQAVGESDTGDAVDSDEEWVDSSSESLGTRSSTDTGSSASKQRRSNASDTIQATHRVEQTMQIAPPPERTAIESWDALDAYLKTYSAASYQCFRVRTNNKVATRNKKIQESGSTKPLVPEEWVHYSKTFVCTHAGNASIFLPAPKYKPRGQGKRKRQESRALECNVQINACVQVTDSAAPDPTFAVGITAARLEHNHPLSRHTFDHYPHNRTAIEPGLAMEG